jgi:hypothetical protein
MRKTSAVLVILIFGLLVQGQQFLSAGNPSPLGVTIVNPSGPVAFGETPEYATLVWNDPWDMSDSLDVRQLDSPRCVWPNHFNDYSPCQDGFWCGQVRSDVNNPDLFLLHPGYSGAMHVGRTGQLRPINADYYTQLTFRMYIDSVDPDDPGLQVYWTNGTVADIGADLSRYGGSHLYKTYPGWHIYTIDLSQETDPLNGNLPWSGQLTGLRLDPGLINMNNRIVRLDWVRLTPQQAHRIEWTTDQDGSVEIRFQSGSVDDDLLVYSGGQYPLSIPASQGYYDVPASLPPGDWYIQLRVNGQTSQAAGPWQIQQTPTLRFIKPSYTSGEDFAQAMLNDPWDMNNPEDVYSYGNTTAPAFSGGILSSTSIDTNPLNTCSGYWENPYLNLLDDNYWDPPFTTDPAVDTTRYRYLTFRLKLDGTPDVSYGWTARVVWSDFSFENCGVTNDIPLHAGWNEVSLDLWDSGILDDEDPCQSPWQASPERRQVRLDPLEVPEATDFYVDSIMLTANDIASQGSVFGIQYELNKSENVTITFYYDTDRNPDNGRTLAEEYVLANPTPPAGPHFVYLPIVLNQYMSGVEVFQWDLTNVPIGTYYISADVNDGYNTTTWYSETPVIITAP